MRRRYFLKGFGCAAAWPFSSFGSETRHVAVLHALSPTDPEAKLRDRIFREALQSLGWFEPGNLTIENRYVPSGPEALAAVARELVATNPDVLVSHATPATKAIQSATRSIPTIFLNVVDPVGPGFVQSLARPGGNITGFVNYQSTLAAKWLDILRDISPNVNRVLAIYNPKTATYIHLFSEPLDKSTAALGISWKPLPFTQAGDILDGVKEFSNTPGAGLLVVPDVSTQVFRGPIIEAAAQNRVPAIYPYRFFPVNGGLLSYGVINADQYRRVASYVDRILKGDKPGELPVQQPTNFEMVINLKTAAALGVNIPPRLVALASELIE